MARWSVSSKLGLGVVSAYLSSRIIRRILTWTVFGSFTLVALLHERLLLLAGSQDRLTGAILSAAYAPDPGPPAPSRATVAFEVKGDRLLAELHEPLLGFAIDTSQVVGGHWWSKEGYVEVGRGTRRTTDFDFDRPKLQHLARALAPARLRVGGTEADHVYYAENARSTVPDGYELVFTRDHWNALVDFVDDVDYSLLFTVNAGPGPRDDDGAWQPDNATELLSFPTEQFGANVIWELGNEVNAYWFIHGPSHRVSGAQYARDFRRFRSLVKGRFKTAKVAGPAGFLWPVMGEPFEGLTGIFEDFLRAGGSEADIVTWHYYPQQSRRCPMATRRASPTTLLNPEFLDETNRWADHLDSLVAKYAPHAELWLGESGNAQCGGEPGVSDRFASSLWYLDQMGMMARRGQPMIRQTLVGSHYGLMDPTTLKPWPDYWAALAYRRLVGGRVLDLTRRAKNPYLRSYAACTARDAGHPPGSVTLLLINLHPSEPARFSLEAPAVSYRFAAASLTSAHVFLNGQRLREESGPGAQLVRFSDADREALLKLGEASPGPGELPPHSYAMVVMESAAPACL